MTSMKSRYQSGSAHVIIIIVLVVAVLGLLGFVLWQNVFNKPPVSTTPTNSTVSDDTEEGWKTYTSSRDGYSIEYPSEWIVIPESDGDGPYIRNFDPTSDEPHGFGYPDGYINVRVLRQTDENYAHLDKTAKEWYDSLGEGTVSDAAVTYEPEDVKAYTLNGIPAKQLKSAGDETDEYIIFLHNSDLYMIIIYPYGGSSDKDVTKMLESFKFIN